MKKSFLLFLKSQFKVMLQPTHHSLRAFVVNAPSLILNNTIGIFETNL